MDQARILASLCFPSFLHTANQVTGPIPARCLVPFVFPGDVLSWSARARAQALRRQQPARERRP
jgi:hypothetical protein